MPRARQQTPTTTPQIRETTTEAGALAKLFILGPSNLNKTLDPKPYTRNPKQDPEH